MMEGAGAGLRRTAGTCRDLSCHLPWPVLDSSFPPWAAAFQGPILQCPHVVGAAGVTPSSLQPVSPQGSGMLLQNFPREPRPK